MIGFHEGETMNTIFTEHLLSVMIAMPFLGIAIIACIQDQEWIRRVAWGVRWGMVPSHWCC